MARVGRAGASGGAAVDERGVGAGGGVLSRVFGDGNHPTTAAAREALVTALARRPGRPGASVLDAGCGTGVLAAAALAAGAGRVVAVDRDPEAVAIARRRAPGAEVLAGDLADLLPGLAGEFDLAAANLPDDQLLARLPDLAAALGPGGELIATGARLWRGRALARAAERAGLRTAARRGSDGWVVILAAKLPVDHMATHAVRSRPLGPAWPGRGSS